MSDSQENTQVAGETGHISNVPETSQNKIIAKAAEREQGLTVRQRNAADLVSLGHTNSEIAEIIGVSRRQIAKWRCNAYFESEVSRLRAQLWVDGKQRLRGLIGKAVKVVESSIDAGDTKAALALLKLVDLKVGAPLVPKSVNETLEVQATKYVDELIGRLPAMDPLRALDRLVTTRPVMIREIYEGMKESLEVPEDEEETESKQNI